MNYSIFAFAHQDDEFGIYFEIEKCLARGDSVYCIYFTDGALISSSLKRNSESRMVLTRLGVKAEQVIFVGDELSVKDGRLHEKVLVCANWLYHFLIGLKGGREIYVPAWEGGHHDHDILNAIVVRCCRLISNDVQAYCFPLYRRSLHLPFLFTVMSPICLTESHTLHRIPVKCRFRYVFYCTKYSSQWRTWLVIFPAVALRYLVRGRQILQRLCLSAEHCRPHPGPLLYEKRGNFTWHEMEKVLRELGWFRATVPVTKE